MKLAVYAIALNEIKHVDRFMQACRGADIVVVADTGSTDGTPERLVQLGAVVRPITVKPFRFDDARNAALALVPDDVDVCVSLDLDEVPEESFFQKIRDGWQEGTDRVWVLWDTGTVWANNNRLHTRHGFRWIKPCHEVTVASRPRPLNEIVIEAVVKHEPDDSKPRTQYLDMLEWAVEEDPRDARMLAYLAREYYFHERWEDIVGTAKRLDALGTGWHVELSATWRNAGYAYQQLGNNEEAEFWYLKSTEQAPNQPEAWFSLSQFYYTQERWQECYDSAAAGIKHKPDTHYLADESTTWRLYDMLALSCWNLGKKGSAKKYARLATKLNPDEQRLKDNYAYMITELSKEYASGLS